MKIDLWKKWFKLLKMKSIDRINYQINKKLIEKNKKLLIPNKKYFNITINTFTSIKSFFWW